MKLRLGNRRGLRGAAIVIPACFLAACGGGGDGSAASPSASTGAGAGNPILYTISVSVAGLSGSGLILELNSASDLAVPADGNFTFSTALPSGTSYTLTVKAQPSSPPQLCAAPVASAVVGNFDVSGIAINCTLSDCPTAPASSAAAAAPTIYALILNVGDDASNSQVVGYPANACGSVSPTASLQLPTSVSSYQSLSVDASGYLYVGAYLGSQAVQSEVLVFAPGANGAATPVRTLVFPGFVVSATSDSNGAIYVATDPNPNGSSTQTILVFAPGSDGSATPVRTIELPGSDDGFGCGQVAVDQSGNIICSISEFGRLQVFANGATGAATPARTISAGGEIVAFSLDPAGNIDVAIAGELHSRQPVSIVEFAGGTGGADTPINTLSADALPNDTDVNSLGVDAAGNLYVCELLAAEPAVLKFAPSANGIASPSMESLTALPRGSIAGPTGFAVD
jgi:hypothetical protein